MLKARINLSFRNQLHRLHNSIHFKNTWADRLLRIMNFRLSFQIQASWNPQKTPVWMLHHQVTPLTFGSSSGSCIFCMGNRAASTTNNRRAFIFSPGSPFIGQSPHATMKSDHEPQTSGVKVDKDWVITVYKIRIAAQCSTFRVVFWSLWPWYAIPIFCQLRCLKHMHQKRSATFGKVTSLDRIDSSPSKLPQLLQLQQIPSHHGYSDDYFCRMTTPPQTNQL